MLYAIASVPLVAIGFSIWGCAVICEMAWREKRRLDAWLNRDRLEPPADQCYGKGSGRFVEVASTEPSNGKEMPL